MSRAPRQERSPAEMARDKRRIAELYLQGRLQSEIGGELGVSQSTVSRVLKELQVEWREASAVAVAVAKAQELARLDVLEREYWAAWQASQRPVKKTSVRQGGPIGSGTVSAIETTESVGNPAFLAGVMACIQRRCEILGVDAPRKQELGGPGGAPLAGPQVSVYLPDNGRGGGGHVG